MNIKKHMPRLMAFLLSFSMALGGVVPAYATDADIIITESPLEETEIDDAGQYVPESNESDSLETVSGNDNIYATNNEIKIYPINNVDIDEDEPRYETIEVSYAQASNYLVTIPKTITLGTDKKSAYPIRVEGDIAANKQVCVVPVDGIEGTEVFDFYMSDQIAGSTKADVIAEISQNKFYWNHEEVASGYEETENYIVAEGLSAGRWKGTFQMEISLRTDPTHIHNYVGETTKEPSCTEPGEKTYNCECGDSYTEDIDPTGHHYENGECSTCGEKDPNHEHSYIESITKSATCTEAGEKTYTCSCGDSYTEKIPATGHSYADGECSDCGEKDPDYHEHKYSESITKEPTCTEDGIKTYTCSCGDSYTEKIPAKGHSYVDGECSDCGEKDPDAHQHSYTEVITKKPTCTETGIKTYTCSCGDNYTEEISATGHNYGENDKCTDCGELNPNHEHSYTEEVTKEATCTEPGEKTLTCVCGDSYTETIPAAGHNYENGKCTECGEEYPHEVEKVNIGDTETRVIAGQTLEFICIDDAYVDSTGETKGALFIAKKFIPGSTLSMGASKQASFEKDWALNPVRTTLNGSTSDLTDLISVNTTVSKAYSGKKDTKNYDMETISSYGTASNFSGTNSIDKVFILSLEEAIKYNKVTINGKTVSTMWDLNGDGEIEFNTSANGYGYYLRTPVSGTTLSAYGIFYSGIVTQTYLTSYGIRPCYVKPSSIVKHNYTEAITKQPTCTEEGVKIYTCECGDSYTETIPIEHDYDLYGKCKKCGKQGAGLYDENDVLVASADELANVYGLDITKYLSGYVNIPPYYKDDPTSLYNILNNNEELSSGVKLIVPEGVTEIGANAFADCTQLRSIVLPDTITKLNNNFVYNCSNLEEITLPISIEFESGTFGVLPKLSKFILTQGTGETVDYTYSYTSTTYKYTPWYINRNNNISVKIEEGVTTIGALTFRECTGLTNIEMADTVTQIDTHAFYKCTGLTNVKMSDAVTKIGNGAFEECTNLTTSLNDLLPENLESLGDNAFYQCFNIQMDEIITIPSKITEIPDNCFGYTGSYQEQEHIKCILPSELKRIGSGAFSSWSFETMGPVGSGYDIEIPSTVTELGGFNGNKKLTTVELPYGVENIIQATFFGCSALNDIYIPDSVVFMGDSMFQGCTSLKTLYIPASVETIGGYGSNFTKGMFYSTSYNSYTYKSTVATIYCGATSKPTNWFTNWNCYGYGKKSSSSSAQDYLLNYTYFDTSREKYETIINR